MYRIEKFVHSESIRGGDNGEVDIFVKLFHAEGEGGGEVCRVVVPLSYSIFERFEVGYPGRCVGGVDLVALWKGKLVTHEIGEIFRKFSFTLLSVMTSGSLVL